MSTSIVTATPVIPDVEPINTSSPRVVFQMNPHPNLLLPLLVVLELGCNKLLKDRSMNRREKMLVQMKATYLQ